MEIDEKAIRKSFLRYAVIAAIVCLIFMFVKRDNIIRWIQTVNTINRQEKKIEALKQDNERLDKRIRSLTENRDSLEAFAREHYGFCAPDEDVYIDE